MILTRRDGAEGVAPGSPPDGGASLDRATSPACETLLAGKLPGAITVDQYHVITLYTRS